MNDSYLTGTHLNDMTVFGPIFVEHELVGFAASRAHWLDVGAKDPGGPMDSTSIYQEGIRLGPTLVVEAGRQRRDVTDLLGRNSRFAYPAVGDLGAQIACTRTGQVRLAAIVRRHGLETILAARDEIFAQTERFERAAVAAIPDGSYRAEGCLDDDGNGDEPCWIRVAVEVAGEEMTIDLTGSGDARLGPVNCGEAQAISACRVAYKLLINPANPPDGGAFRPLSVKVRAGSTLGAEDPYPCQWYFSQLGLLIDLVVKALADVLPDAAAGASYGDSMVIMLSGADPRFGNRPWLDLEPTVGGWGAWRGSDGESGLINNVNGSLKDLTIEVLETKYPMRVTHYGFRADSGGPGRWRGGNGVIREYTLDCDGVMSLWFERSKTPGWGLFGGREATPPIVVVNPGREDERRMLKAANVPLRKGDVVRTMTGGGGGLGDPRERDPEAVRRDLRDRMVSREAAREMYGVDP